MGKECGTQAQATPAEHLAATESGTLPPAVYLLLWYVGCNGMPGASELQALGMDEAGVRELMAQYHEEFVELRRMVKLTQLLDLGTLGALLRGKLLSQLAQASKPVDVARLASAAKSLPAWAMPQGYFPATRGGSLLDGSLESELEAIRRQRGQQPLNRAARRAQASSRR